MTQENGMADNPGDPRNTDPEATTAEQAEAAAEEARETQSFADETDTADLDPTLESDIDEALADIDAELAEKEAADEAAEEAPAEPTVEEQLAERTEDLQRLSAEYANYRRRTERERKVGVDNAKAQVIAQLLPILDDMDLAEQHGDMEGPVKAFHDKIISIFSTLKVQAFGAEGDEFDPERHEAVQDLSSGDEKAIGTVLRKGYMLGDERLLRTAMVIIADPSQKEAE